MSRRSSDILKVVGFSLRVVSLDSSLQLWPVSTWVADTEPCAKHEGFLLGSLHASGSQLPQPPLRNAARLHATGFRLFHNWRYAFYSAYGIAFELIQS